MCSAVAALASPVNIIVAVYAANDAAHLIALKILIIVVLANGIIPFLFVFDSAIVMQAATVSTK